MAPRQPRESWFKRNIVWMVPVGCLGLIGIVALVGFGAVMGLKSTFVFAEGVALAAANPEVIEALGEPIEGGLGFSGTIDFENDSGSADGQIPIKGPKGNATLHVVATKRDGEWSFQVAEVEIEGRAERIDLLAER